MADDAPKPAMPDDADSLLATGSSIPPKRVIRTYASDVAKLTGAPVPEQKPGSERKSEPPPAERTPAGLPPLKKEGEAPFVPKPPEPKAPSREDIRRVLPAPSYQGPFVGSTFTPTTYQEPEDIETRDQILARLRTKVASYRAENPAPPPVFPTPRPEPMSEPLRTPPPPPQIQTPAPAPATPDPLRTWSGDFSDHIQEQNASAFSVLAAQADAPRPVAQPAIAPARAKGNRGLLYALIATALFVGGSTLLYFGYEHFKSNQPVPVVSNAPSALIVGDDTTQISGSGSGLMLDLMNAASAALPSGDVRIVYLSVPTTTPAGTTTILEPGGSLIAALGLPAPDILLRNIGPSSTVGIVNAGGDTRVFFILDAESYERTFAGMLAWEPTMAHDLASLYPPFEAETEATSTATTTQATSTAPITISAPAFVDEVVDSHDARALKDDNGNTILIWGYRDQKTLIIARNETAFSLLLARLSATATE